MRDLDKKELNPEKLEFNNKKIINSDSNNDVIYDERDFELCKFLIKNLHFDFTNIERIQITNRVLSIIGDKVKNSNCIVGNNNNNIITFESRTGIIKVKELKSFLLKEGIKGKVLPYIIDWDKGIISFELNLDGNEPNGKYKLMSLIRKNGFFPIQINKEYLYDKKNNENIHIVELALPVIILTGPRGAGKNFFSEKFLNLFSEYISIVPQISCRDARIDDDINYIKILSQSEFDEQKENMLVYTGKYGILKSDLNSVFEKGKIPLMILGWKEIIKINKKTNGKNIIINITFPINLNGELSNNTINTIYEKRLSERGWSHEEKRQNIELIKKYMQLFFNNPTFKKLFSYNYDSIEGDEKEFIEYFKKLIFNIVT